MFHQPWHLYLALGLALLAAIKISLRAQPEPEPEPVVLEARFFGGPLDGRKERIPQDELPPYFMSPYLTDEQKEEMYAGEVRIMPTIAYYAQVDDNAYFYKRDVTPDEIPVIQNNNGLPNG